MSRLRRRLLWAAATVAGLVTAAGCVFWWLCDGPGSRAGLQERYEPLFMPKVEMLGRLAKAVDAQPEVVADELRPGLNPPLNARGDESNCGMAKDWEVRLPARYPTGPASLEVEGSSRLVSISRGYRENRTRDIRWAGPYTRSDREWMDKGLSETYLVVTRQRSYRPFVERDEAEPIGGEATAEGFVFDLRTEDLIGRLTITVRVSPSEAAKLEPTAKYMAHPEETTFQASVRKRLGETAGYELRTKLSRLSGVTGK